MRDTLQKAFYWFSLQFKNWHQIAEIEDAKISVGRLLSMNLPAQQTTLAEVEFKVFSQFGDDGIIQYLVHHLNIEPAHQLFVEFGVQDYTESNTRFLLLNNNWRGLVMDGSKKNIDFIKRDKVYWRHDINAVHAWIDRDNINTLIEGNGFAGEIGLLSIDIDGNDYWVWEAINVIRPFIVISEYNSVFGSEHAVTVPYDPAFYRTAAHFSNLYWGCSLGALNDLATRKGYVFVGSNSAGNNAYFVRKDKLSGLRSLSVSEGYVESKFRESRDINGNLSFLRGVDRLQVIKEMPVFHVGHDRIFTIKELFGI